MHWSYALQQGTFTLFPDTASTMPVASAVALTMLHSSWRWPHQLGKQSPVSLYDMFSEPLLGSHGGAGAKANLIQTSLRHQRISVIREVKGWPGGAKQSRAEVFLPSAYRLGGSYENASRQASQHVSLSHGPQPLLQDSQRQREKEIIRLLRNEFLGPREGNQHAQSHSASQVQTQVKNQDLLTLHTGRFTSPCSRFRPGSSSQG